jgi:CHRD domain
VAAKANIPTARHVDDKAIKGNATLTPDQAKEFSAGQWYINVHTNKNPEGEIRGQVNPPKG